MLASLLRDIARRLGAGDGDLPDAIPRLAASGRHKEAERRLRRHLARRPDDAQALHFLGLVCHELGRADEAVELIGRAVEVEPQPVFHANLAEACRASGRLEKAERHARQAASLAPDNAMFALKLAAILAQLSRPAEALEWAERVLERDPECFDALLLAAGLNSDMVRPQRALEHYRKAHALKPEHPGPLIGCYRALRWMCDWSLAPSGLAELMQRWAERPDDPAYASINPFLAYEIPVPQAVRKAVTQAQADRVLRQAASAPGRFVLDRRAKDRLRIGYLSADYHSHPTMHLMRGLFSLHDRSRFQIFAYSLGADDGSPFRQEIVSSADSFRDVRLCTAGQAAGLIHGDAIDILVDLKGYTHSARPEILALKPAPLRVAWLGYPASTGCGLNDYMIADRVVVPPEAEGDYGEKLAWLPHSYQINDSDQPIDPATPSRTDLGLPEEGFVFACFNHVYKIEPLMFSVWMRVLAAVPGSVLWLYESNPAARTNLQREASERGIEPSRLHFAGTLPKPRHLARLKRADLFLDTLYVNAHTGASDALWAGLPVLTCPQEAFPSRVAASLVTAAELSQLVCSDLAEYEANAIRLARRPDELRSMRRHLETRHASLPLFDTARFTRNLERAYETMWRRHIGGEAPASFLVAESSRFTPGPQSTGHKGWPPPG